MLPVLSEEYEVALIVKRNDAATMKLRIVREQRSKYSRKCAAQSCVEVVQNHFWHVRCHLSTPLQWQEKYKKAADVTGKSIAYQMQAHDIIHSAT